MPYITPSQNASDEIARILHIPNDIKFIAAVSGALLALTRAENWEQVELDTLTPEQAAEAMQTMLDGYWENFVMPSLLPIGTIMSLIHATLPTNWLPMDGTRRLRVDFPELYDLMPAIWHWDANEFVLPNMVRKTIVGQDAGVSGFQNIGAMGGADSTILNESQIPIHSHAAPPYSLNYNAPNGFYANAVGVDNAYATQFTPPRTGNTGGSQPHSNFQPYIIVKYAIVATL